MYNIHNHYNNIYDFIQSIIAEPSVVYLHPFGATQPENVEVIGTPIRLHKPRSFSSELHYTVGKDPKTGPVLICYDQEPLLFDYNQNLFTFITNKHIISRRLGKHQQFDQAALLLSTELDSDEKDKILSEYNLIDCYYFHHAFAASDWYRGYQYLTSLTAPLQRKLNKKFITFNRITSNARIHRSILVGHLIKNNLLSDGHVSYSINCPLGGHYSDELRSHATMYGIPDHVVDTTTAQLDTLLTPPRIDFVVESEIPNNSFHITAIKENMESFVHVVTETCYWGRKKHLTEKIFKPIVMRQPFILVGCAHNLEYLKSYGFKTFDRWWDESYDQIENDIERMDAISQLLTDICKNDLGQLTQILHDMNEVLEYNYNWFYSREFLDHCWKELTTNIQSAISK